MNYRVLEDDEPVAHPLIKLKMAEPAETTTTAKPTTTSTIQSTLNEKENYVYEESTVSSQIPDKINFVSSMDIRELSSKWLLSLRAKRNAANMRYPEWSSDFRSQLDILPKCDLRGLEPIVSLESELTVTRLTVSDPYDTKAIFRSFEEDFMKQTYISQLTYSEVSEFACQLDICRSPNGESKIFHSKINMFRLVRRRTKMHVLPADCIWPATLRSRPPLHTV